MFFLLKANHIRLISEKYLLKWMAIIPVNFDTILFTAYLFGNCRTAHTHDLLLQFSFLAYYVCETAWRISFFLWKSSLESRRQAFPSVQNDAMSTITASILYHIVENIDSISEIEFISPIEIIKIAKDEIFLWSYIEKWIQAVLPSKCF